MWDKDDEKISEIYDEMQKDQKETNSNFLNKIPNDTRMWLAIGVGIMVVLVWIQKIDITKGLVGIGAVLLMVYIFLNGETEKKMLTEQECKISLYQKLRFKQLNPYGNYYEITPDAKIKIGHAGKLRFFDARPWKREIGYVLQRSNGLEDYHSADIDIWTGDIIGTKKRPEGFTGKEPTDIKTIPGKDMVQEKRYQEYIGKSQNK